MIQVQVLALAPSRVVCGDAVVLRGRMFWFLGDDDRCQPIVSFLSDQAVFILPFHFHSSSCYFAGLSDRLSRAEL